MTLRACMVRDAARNGARLLTMRIELSTKTDLILVTHESPNRLDWLVRWRAGDRLILGL